MQEAVVAPFIEYFQRPGAVVMLLFIIFYKAGDWMATSITTPFYLELGFSKTEIGAVTKLYGTWMLLGGVGLGGLAILRLGIVRCLWIFGALQALSTACFAILAEMGYSLTLLTAVISFENLSSGLGTSAFTAFMATQTNKRFTATQYALLTSFVGVQRSVFSATTGFLAEGLGWTDFFLFCALLAVPGMALLWLFAPWNAKDADVLKHTSFEGILDRLPASAAAEAATRQDPVPAGPLHRAGPRPRTGRGAPSPGQHLAR